MENSKLVPATEIIYCKICKNESAEFAVKKILGRYDIRYYRCPACHFIQTEDPYWLGEAYGNVITQLDIGLVYRNENLAPLVATIINLLFDPGARFLDFGGGYGLFVRMMRDRGFDFYRQDIYCENLFAKHFDVRDLRDNSGFNLLTAFEVYEHLKDPVDETGKMLRYADNILFTTELQPESQSALDDWWYFIPETGQHISLYTKLSLEIIADKFNMHLISRNNLHLFSRTQKSKLLFNLAFLRNVQRLVNYFKRRRSLLAADFKTVQRLKT